MFGIKAFFLSLGAFFSSLFFHANVHTNDKVIFQVQPSATPNGQQNPTPFPTLYPTSTPIPSQSLQNFIYPGGTQTGISNNSLSLQTTDDASTVFSWYQTKISALSLRTTNIIATNTNGNALDILEVATATQSIKIQIQRKAADSITFITVTSDANFNSGSSVNVTNSI
ncbi:MAG TPA: hypothetical protein VF820_04635 [Patescibacteria group bacterium]